MGLVQGWLEEGVCGRICEEAWLEADARQRKMARTPTSVA